MNLSKSFKHGSRGRSTLDSVVARNWGKVSKSSLPLPSAFDPSKPSLKVCQGARLGHAGIRPLQV